MLLFGAFAPRSSRRREAICRTFAVLLLLASLVPAARAVMPGPHAREDAKRFGFDRFKPVQRRAPSTAAFRAYAAYNKSSGGRWTIRFSPRTGLPAALVGGQDSARPGRTPDAAAREFLAAHADILGVDAAGLTIERQTKGKGSRHLLYRQSYKGIPVELAAVKVHLDERGAVLGVHSTYEPAISAPASPSVPAAAAGRTAAADAGGGSVRDTPTLVILPLETDGLNHLAWKMRVDSWRYYVDAVTGQVLLRYSVDEFAGPCLSSGVVSGWVYDQDPSATPGAAGQGVVRGFNNQYVYVGPSGPGGYQALTGYDVTFSSGFFCSPVAGQVTMSLQGPFVSVSEFTGRNAHYDDGNGVWTNVATRVSSPHPYPDSSVIVSTIDIGPLAPGAVSFLPVFSDYNVGTFGGGAGEGSGDITDDDQVTLTDQNGNAVAAYVGDRGPFNGAEVHGSKMTLTLRSNASGQNNGYDILVSSVLTLSNPTVDNAPYSSHTWTAADTVTGLRGEMNLFYHLNLMHDYFANGVNSDGAAAIVRPVIAMAHVGPNLLNAFYDSDYDAIYFGDVNALAPSEAFTNDATVPHHEYVHYVVNKIWSIFNYGLGGTLSEANADYFSASSLDDSSIGAGVVSALGATSNSGTGAVRELDDQKSGAVVFNLNTPAVSPWVGEIHSDSPFLSQALWDIRRAKIAQLGHDAGRACADGMQFQALLYFPESFSELYEDLLQVDKLGAVQACGGASVSQSLIYNSFSAHGILPSQGDAYEPNNGFESAVDISTLGVISATIYPISDSDFYSFGAGPGLVQATLTLPAVGGGLYKAYQLILYDHTRSPVAGAAPPYNGPFTTVDGICNPDDCETTARQVVLSYNNPAGDLLYIEVDGGDSQSGSNSGVNSPIPYTLGVSYPLGGALSGAVVGAQFDRDVIGFTIHTSTFVSTQDWTFASAQLRDQTHSVMPGTLTHVPALAGDYLLFVGSANAGGKITGQVRLAPGFSSRFPSAGTVYLEVFATDAMGRTSSMGESNPLTLTDNGVELNAFNNVFNPLLGQQATIKYGVDGPGQLTIKLYTITGRLVATLLDASVPAGKGTLQWNGQNSAGNVVASGVYVVRAQGPGLTATQKIAVVK